MKTKALMILFILLTAFTALTVFSSCSDKQEGVTSAAVTSTPSSTKAVTVINDDGDVLEVATEMNNYTIYMPPKSTISQEIEYTYAINELPDSNSSPNNSENGNDKNAEIINDKVEEKSKGISVIANSSTVYKGNSATIMIQGQPGKKYSIDFYENLSQKADYEGLETKTADKNGIVTWTFTIDDPCSLGRRKVYIKEINSENYLQTSIYVQ